MVDDSEVIDNEMTDDGWGDDKQRCLPRAFTNSGPTSPPARQPAKT
jgi:hypothetical protein